MSQSQLPVVIIQTRAREREHFAEFWPAIRASIEEAAVGGGRLVVLPECTIPGYVIGETPLDPAQIFAALSDVQAIVDSYDCVVVIGAALPIEDGVHDCKNVAAVLCPRSAPQYVAKRFLWHFDSRWFDAGDDAQPVSTPLGKLGIVVCADGRIPTIARKLVDRGAELLVVVTAWVTSGRDPAQLENVQADLLVRVRAWENRVPLIAANKVGTEYSSVQYCGKSQVVDADGTVRNIASQHLPEIMRCDVTLGARQAPVRMTAPSPPAVHLPSPALRIGISRRLDAEQLRMARFSSVDVCIASAAHVADDALIVLDRLRAPSSVICADLSVLAVDEAAAADPAYLVAARLQGYDFFIFLTPTHDTMRDAVARTRAIELRAYVLYAVDGELCLIDPNGMLIARSSPTLPFAQCVYDPALSAAATIVPNTDVLAGLRRAEQY